jgi:hypothetical protein
MFCRGLEYNAYQDSRSWYLKAIKSFIADSDATDAIKKIFLVSGKKADLLKQQHLIILHALLR